MIPATDTCPPLEEIAAFLDGRLSERERARVVAHLADCSACYEVFAGAARFQLDSGKVLPFWRRTSVWRAAAAAAAVLTVGLATFAWYRANREMPPMRSASLVAPLAGVDALSRRAWTGPILRGKGEEIAYSRKSFRLGVQLVNLRLSLAAGDERTAADAMGRIYGLLRDEEWVGEQAEFFRKSVAPLDEGKVPPQDLLESVTRHEAGLDEAIPSPYLPFGKWTAAGYLSAIAQDAGFFHDPKNRRALGWLLRNAEEERLDSAVVKRLRAIQETLDADRLGTAEYDTLRKELAAILSFYDRGA